MLFNAAFFGGILFVHVVFAVPFALVARFARRREGHQYQINNHPEQVAGAISNVQYNGNWAGAVKAEGKGTFTSVIGMFTVPTPSGPTGASAAAWVGIDGVTCDTVILQTGITFTVENSQPKYNAWYEWYPAPSYNFSGITISAGDVIRLTVTAPSETSGTAEIENLSNGQTVSKSLTSSTPLCRQNAEWVVEDYGVDNSTVPFADFGTVTFTNAEATGNGTYTPSGATLYDIEQNNQVLTSVSTSESSVTIQYV